MAIYLDHNATTPMAPEVFEAMKPYLTSYFGNPSSIHQFGQQAQKAISDARQTLAEFINCDPKEVVFLSGGTESDNTALRGVVKANAKKGRHIITSEFEHHAVLNTAKALEKEEINVTFLPTMPNGLIRPEDLEAAIRPDTILVSIMMVNNETGVIQPIKELVTVAKKHGVLFHTDAVQGAGKIQIDVKDLGVDLLTITAHKFYGPKGIGMLYIKRGTPIRPLIIGGHHENNRRAGTENVAGIVGFGAAAQLAMQHMEKDAEKVGALRDKLESKVREAIPEISIAGENAPRVFNTSNILFHLIEGEGILLNLDIKGVAVSTGSACTSGTLEPSHVLLAMHIPSEIGQGAIRFSLGHDNTAEEIDFVVDQLKEIIPKLRAMSPLWDKFQKGELNIEALRSEQKGCQV